MLHLLNWWNTSHRYKSTVKPFLFLKIYFDYIELERGPKCYWIKNPSAFPFPYAMYITNSLTLSMNDCARTRTWCEHSTRPIHQTSDCVCSMSGNVEICNAFIFIFTIPYTMKDKQFVPFTWYIHLFRYWQVWC